jgi:hypothetical protein
MYIPCEYAAEQQKSESSITVSTAAWIVLRDISFLLSRKLPAILSAFPSGPFY